MTSYFEEVRSLSISEGITGVRILIVTKLGEEVEYLTDGNQFRKKLK